MLIRLLDFSLPDISCFYIILAYNIGIFNVSIIMALSNEEKQKIEAEEEYRARVKGELHKKKKGSFVKKLLIALLIIFFGIPAGIGLLVGIFSPNTTSSDTPKVEQDTSDLVGTVNSSNGYIHVTNTEDKDWKDCFFTVNSDYHAPYNWMQVRYTIPAGETSSYSFSDFVNKDGEVFNPYKYKLMKISGSCGQRFGYWEW